MSEPRRLILVTGMPRSGTTPCGHNLELASGVAHVYEPFNPNYGMPEITRHYQVPGANGFSCEHFDQVIDNLRRLRLRLKRYADPREPRLRRWAKRLIADRARLAYWRCRLTPGVNTIIWKDPNACFAARAAVDRHRIPVVVTVRPAVAVAASYRRMAWQTGVREVANSLAQIDIRFPELFARYGERLDNEAIGAAVLWYMVYATLLQWAETRPLMTIVDLQRSIDQPIETYRRLYDKLALPWSERVAERLRRQYAQQHRPPAPRADALPQRAHLRHRSVADVNTYGAKLLTAEEVSVIQAITGELSSRLQQAARSVGAAPAAVAASVAAARR